MQRFAHLPIIPPQRRDNDVVSPLRGDYRRVRRGFEKIEVILGGVFYGSFC
jgi:hypothetical protein